jgi:hypothetical protein
MDVGFDGGFYATKAVSGDRVSHFPSFATKPAESLFSLNGHATVIIASEHGRHLVGDEAVKKGRTGARKESSAWIMSREYMSLFYTALSDLTDAYQVTVNCVAGLPLADFARDQAVLRDRLLGTHRFTREGRAGQTVKVERVTVVPQAWGRCWPCSWMTRVRWCSLSLSSKRSESWTSAGTRSTISQLTACLTFPRKRGALSAARGTWLGPCAIALYKSGIHVPPFRVIPYSNSGPTPSQLQRMEKKTDTSRRKSVRFPIRCSVATPPAARSRRRKSIADLWERRPRPGPRR